MIAAVVLAAGKSSRMGRDKALLPFRGSTFLESIVSTLQSIPVDRIVVVLGYHADEIQAAIPLQKVVEVVVNPRYREGQTTSLLEGIYAVDSENLKGILLCLVDHPLISTDVVHMLQQAFREKRPPVVIPTYQGRRGHPVIFSRALFEEFRTLAPQEGANQVARRHRAETLFVEVQDDAILRDVDTPADYEQLTSGKDPAGTKN